MEQQEIIERIEEILRINRLTRNGACQILGLGTSNLGNMLKGKQKITDKTLRLISQKFNVSLEWLLTGEGDMNTSHVVRPEETIYVPLLPMTAQAGSISYFAESASLSDCEQIISPIKGADYAIRVSGESMAPEYPNGSQVLIKKIDPTKFIAWGQVFVVDTHNGAVMKRLVPGSEPDRIKCISLNPDPVYAPFEVLWEDVIGVYRVLLCMSLK